MEDIEINKKELIKQRDDEIKTHGEYIEVRIMIPKDEKEPVFTDVDIHGVGIKEVAKMIKTLEATEKKLAKKFPMAYMMSHFLGVDTEEVED